MVAVAGDAPRADSGSKAVGRDVLADCMVGQINGRPVFASEILDPLSGRLTAAAKEVKGQPSAQVWVRDTAKLIQSAVQLRVRDELLLGEARARLTPEQKQGLIYFIQRVDQWASGQSGGSQEQAKEAIKNRTGEDYDKFLQSQRDQTLIRDLIKENVTPFVRVPWRKVERYYLDNETQINPPPFAVVRIVMIDSANTDAVARAQAAAGAADGGAFKEVAQSEANVFERAKAGLVAKKLENGYEKIEWVGNKTWNAEAAKLTPGHFAGPIDTGTFKVFIRREDDFITPHRSLEDAQLEITTRLTIAKETQEQNEFFMQLLGKGSFTPVGRMTMELLVLAAQRHLPPDLAALVRDANPLGVDSTPGLERSPAPQMMDDVSLNPPKKGGKAAPTPTPAPTPAPAPAPANPAPATLAPSTPAPSTPAPAATPK